MFDPLNTKLAQSGETNREDVPSVKNSYVSTISKETLE